MMKLATTKTAATAVSRMTFQSRLVKADQLVSKLGGLRTKATAAIPLNNSGSQQQAKRYAQLGGLALGFCLAQYQFGTAENFFEHRFTTTKSAEDLADLYGTEDFME